MLAEKSATHRTKYGNFDRFFRKEKDDYQYDGQHSLYIILGYNSHYGVLSTFST